MESDQSLTSPSNNAHSLIANNPKSESKIAGKHSSNQTNSCVDVNSFAKQSNNLPKLLPLDFKPSRYDVLCGRGKGMYLQPGNELFRAIIVKHADSYKQLASKAHKIIAVNKIYDEILAQNNGNARFVRKVKDRWIEVDALKIRDKIGHAIRELMGNRRVTYIKKSGNESQKIQRNKCKSSMHQKTSAGVSRGQKDKQQALDDVGHEFSTSLSSTVTQGVAGLSSRSISYSPVPRHNTTLNSFLDQSNYSNNQSSVECKDKDNEKSHLTLESIEHGSDHFSVESSKLIANPVRPSNQTEINLQPEDIACRNTNTKRKCDDGILTVNDVAFSDKILTCANSVLLNCSKKLKNSNIEVSSSETNINKSESPQRNSFTISQVLQPIPTHTPSSQTYPNIYNDAHHAQLPHTVMAGSLYGLPVGPFLPNESETYHSVQMDRNTAESNTYFNGPSLVLSNDTNPDEIVSNIPFSDNTAGFYTGTGNRTHDNQPITPDLIGPSPIALASPSVGIAGGNQIDPSVPVLLYLIPFSLLPQSNSNLLQRPNLYYNNEVVPDYQASTNLV